MRRLAGLPTGRLVLFTSMGKIVPRGAKPSRPASPTSRRRGTRVRELARAGRTVEEIREELFAGGSSLAALTGGHFSTDNLIASLLKTGNA